VLRVGLTGGIASGKSTVGAILTGLGARVFDADGIVAELYRAGGPGARAVEESLGAGFLAPDGSVDKAKVAREVFSDAASRRRLECAVHPLVAAEIRGRFAEARKDGAAVAVAEASLIFEARYGDEFDRVVLVVSPETDRLQRGLEKGFDSSELTRRMAAQIPEIEAREKADDVIVNDGTVEDLRAAVERLYAGWIAPDRKA
jgi:dephospho-CoA kinase